MKKKLFELNEKGSFILEDGEPLKPLGNVVHKLNDQQATITSLKERNKQLRRRLEKINGGYGHLTHRNGLTANEWVIESQEKELKKKNEQISAWIERHSKDIVKIGEQQATIQRMKHSLNTIYKAFEKHYGYDMRNAVWLIDELSYDEIVDELYIAETDSKNRKEASMYWKKKVDEQQVIIDKQELRLQRLEELLELSENLNKSYREKLIDMNLKMGIDDEC